MNEEDMLTINIEELAEEVVNDLKNNNVENGRVNDLDIMIACENYLSEYKSDVVNRVYTKLEEEEIEYY